MWKINGRVELEMGEVVARKIQLLQRSRQLVRWDRFDEILRQEKNLQVLHREV